MIPRFIPPTATALPRSRGSDATSHPTKNASASRCTAARCSDRFTPRIYHIRRILFKCSVLSQLRQSHLDHIEAFFELSLGGNEWDEKPKDVAVRAAGQRNHAVFIIVLHQRGR